MKRLPIRLLPLALCLLPAAAQAVEWFGGFSAHAALPDCPACEDQGGVGASFGVRFIPAIGLEGGLQTFGQRRDKTESTNRIDTDTTTTLSASFGLVGQFPFGEVVRFEWRAGVHAWSVNLRHETCTRGSSSANWRCDKSHGGSLDEGFDPYAGLGVEVLLSKLVSLEGHYTRFRFTDVVDKHHVDNAGAGVRFRF